MTDKPESTTTEKLISHPLEKVFDIEEGSTAVMAPESRDTQLVEAPTYDRKDIEIEENFQEIYDKAMDAFDDMQTAVEGIEGKYKARASEVSVQMLNAALNAAKEKSRLKEHKDNLKLKSGGGGSVPSGSTINNNTLINVSTSDIIRQLANAKSPVQNQIEEIEEVEDVTTIEQTTPPPRKMQRKPKQDSSGS